jgi:hypothetical protein
MGPEVAGVNVDNPVWDLFDTPCKDEWEQESGEIVYNKRKNWEYSSHSLGLI